MNKYWKATLAAGLVLAAGVTTRSLLAPVTDGQGPAPGAAEFAPRPAVDAADSGRAAGGAPAGQATDASPGCVPEARYLPNADGTTTTVYVCPDVAPTGEQPYANYPTEALESLAYADGKAAEVLGMRLRETDEARAISLILRASALAGGDPGPILAFSNAYPHPTAIDGVLVRKTVHTKFVLSAVAELLGAERNNLPYWKTQIRQASSDPEREIELLLERAERVLEEMRQIELDVTGASTFGGQSDA